MKITPIDIQQMVFQVKFRGYDRDEVNRFLEELALTVENLNRDNSALRDKLDHHGATGRRFAAHGDHALEYVSISADAGRGCEAVRAAGGRSNCEGSRAQGERDYPTGPSEPHRYAARSSQTCRNNG